jgi:hypothetical protein
MRIYQIPNFLKKKDLDRSLTNGLLDHQYNTFIFSHELEKNKMIQKDDGYVIVTDSAIYCDPSGTGKTFVMLNLIKNLWQIKPLDNKILDITSESSYVYRKIIHFELYPITLIVSNKKNTHWWLSNCYKYLDSFSIYDLDKVYKLDKNNPSIIVANYHNVHKFFIDSSKITISRIIYDDIHEYKYGGLCNASFTWFVTSNIELLFLKKEKINKDIVIDKIKKLFSLNCSGPIFCNNPDLILKSIQNTSLEKFYTPKYIEHRYSDDKKDIDDLVSKGRMAKSALLLNTQFDRNLFIQDSSINDPITLDKIKNPLVTNCCKQYFDLDSFIKYLILNKNYRCPLCRELIDLSLCKFNFKYNEYDNLYKLLNDIIFQLYDLTSHTLFVFINTLDSNIIDILSRHNIYVSNISYSDPEDLKTKKLISGFKKGYYNLYIDRIQSKELTLTMTKNIVIISDDINEEIMMKYLDSLLKLTNTLGRKYPLQIIKILPSP